MPAWIDPKPLEDVSAITFFGERLVEEKPVLKTWMLGSPAKIPFDTIDKRTGQYHLAGGLRRESVYPVDRRATRTPRPRACALNLSDPLQLNRLHITAAVLAGHGSARPASASIC